MTLPTLQIGGLISGLDTNAIIAGLIDLERLPIQTLENRRSVYEAKDSAWQDINTRLSAVRTAFNAINDSSDFDKLVTAASSNEAAVSGAPTGSATPGTITFAVNQLATTHRVGSTAAFSGADALVGAGDFTISMGGSDSVVTASASTRCCRHRSSAARPEPAVSTRMPSFAKMRSRLCRLLGSSSTTSTVVLLGTVGRGAKDSRSAGG